MLPSQNFTPLYTGSNYILGLKTHYWIPLIRSNLERTISEEAFGKVSKGIHVPTSEPVAIKTLEKDQMTEQEDIDRIAREIHILKKLRHPNVIQLYEVTLFL